MWSSIVDDFVLLDATREAMIEFSIAERSEEIRRSTNEICDRLDRGEKQHAMLGHTWEEALAWRKQIHGELAMPELTAKPEQDKFDV